MPSGGGPGGSVPSGGAIGAPCCTAAAGAGAAAAESVAAWAAPKDVLMAMAIASARPWHGFVANRFMQIPPNALCDSHSISVGRPF